MTDRKSQVTAYAYDALDRLTTITYQGGATVTYTYDAGDRITSIADSINGTITRAYDDLDRLTSETTPQGTIAYTYDAAGRRSTATVTGQPAVSYGYDAANRLTSVTQGTAAVGLAYDLAGRRSSLTLPNGVTTTYGYDAADALTSLQWALGGTPLGDLTYGYDLAGRRVTIGGSFARTNIPPALGSATYDLGNRLLTWDGTSYTYDLNGNLTGDGMTTYTWNARNQLTAIAGGATGGFTYDAVGRRTSRTVGGVTTNYLYDGADAVQEQIGGSPSANYLLGLGIDERFTRTDGTGTVAYLADALGSTVALTDGAGAVATTYTYEPYGLTTQSGVGSANPGRYTGREEDGTGLYYYRARYYDPQRQRFVSEDPIGLAGGSSVFGYAHNAPTIWADPLGLKPASCFGCSGSSAAGSGSTGAGAGSGSGAGGGSGGASGGQGQDGQGADGQGDSSDRKRGCESYGQRWWRDVVNTNLALPGLFAPSGLGGGLRAWETVAQTVGVAVDAPITVMTAPAVYPGILVSSAVSGGAYAATAIGYEIGVAIGSAIDAGLIDPCGSF